MIQLKKLYHTKTRKDCMKKSNFFALMSRMKYISRWGLMKNTVPENIQEHSLMVCMIAHALCIIKNEYFDGKLDPGFCAAAAIYHDAPEILTGDLPTPVKYFNSEIHSAYKKIEEVSTQNLLSMLDESLQKYYAPLFNCEQENPDAYAVIKAADRISAYIKCLEELKSGNNEFKQAAEQTLASIRLIDLPEVGYFMEHFIEGFSLSLDDLR